jgi:tripartite-type tricarboxylate transporter receptor subunit TctC
MVASGPQVLVVNPKNMPVTDLKGFLELVRKSPGKFNYGSAGTGTSHHLAGELFKQQTKTFITHIPYTGAGPSLRDLVGGQVDMMFDGIGSSAAHIKGGRVNALMVSGTKRNPGFPDVPCAAELGLPEYTVTTWYGLWAPKGTPPEIQARIIEEVRKACTSDDLKPIWAGQGAEFPSMNQQQFAAFINAEIKRWATVVKASGAKLD